MTKFTKSFLWNFRETYAEHYLGDSVKKYGNLFDTVSYY